MTTVFHGDTGDDRGHGAVRRRRVVRRTVELRLAWRGGLTARARCLRACTTRSHDTDGRPTGSTRRHAYAVTPRDGQTVRFEERGGPGTVLEGDLVVVHCAAARPRRATAIPPGGAANEAKALFTVAFMGAAVAFRVAFAAPVPS